MENNLCSLETTSTWKINCTIYCIAISCKEICNDLPTGKIQNKKYNKPEWIVNLENSIERIQREMADKQVVIECKILSNLPNITPPASID